MQKIICKLLHFHSFLLLNIEKSFHSSKLLIVHAFFYKDEKVYSPDIFNVFVPFPFFTCETCFRFKWNLWNISFLLSKLKDEEAPSFINGWLKTFFRKQSSQFLLIIIFCQSWQSKIYFSIFFNCFFFPVLFYINQFS